MSGEGKMGRNPEVRSEGLAEGIWIGLGRGVYGMLRDAGGGGREKEGGGGLKGSRLDGALPV